MSKTARTLTAFLPVLLAAPLALAAECIIQGKAVDETGQGLADVRILVSDKASGRKTKGASEKGGKYYIRGIPPADYEIVFEKEGYTSHTWVGHLTAGKPETIDATLQSTKGGKPAGGDAAAAAASASSELGKDFNEGVTKFNAKDYDGAIAAFQKVAEKKPDIADPLYNIGLCYQRKKDYLSAETWLRKTIEKKADHAGAHFNLAFALFQQKKTDDALAVTQKAAELDPSAETAYNCGMLLKSVNQPGGSFDMFQLATTRDATYADAHRELGYVYLARNDAAGARASLSKYLELDAAAEDAAEVKQILDQIK